MARTLSIGEVIKPSIQSEIVQVGEQRRAGVPPVPTGKVIQISARVPIQGVDERFEPEVVVVQDREGRKIVIAEHIAIRKLQIVHAAAQRRLRR